MPRGLVSVGDMSGWLGGGGGGGLSCHQIGYDFFHSASSQE